MGLEHNIIDIAINEWRKSLRASVHVMNRHCEHFYVIFHWFCFPQVVQKQTFGEVGNYDLTATCVRNICIKNY